MNAESNHRLPRDPRAGKVQPSPRGATCRRMRTLSRPRGEIRQDSGVAYDEAFADRVRELVFARTDASERKMFGGICFMIAGNMAVGVIGDDLIVRLDKDEAQRALTENGVREFDFTGRPAKGMVYVSRERTVDPASLEEWVDAGTDYAASLPAK
jgi:TfoX/Sxy family transcriptional regulator of competence genes